MTATVEPAATRAAASVRPSIAFLTAFGALAVGIGAGRAITTTYVPVLLHRIQDSPGLIGAVMLVNAVAGFGVPLLVGVWSDRESGSARAFIVGGSLLTAGGLVAVALGTASSYVWLAIAAALVYTGLNATATVHRALVVDRFGDAQRPAATSSQELSMLAGGLLGVLAGGALVADAASLLFLAVAVVALLAAIPTLAAIDRRGRGRAPAAPAGAADGARRGRPRMSEFVEVMRRPGARSVLIAQILWVMAYAALPAFVVLYAGDVLGLGPAPAGGMLAAFGLLTAAGMVVAARTAPERVHRRLVAGAALLGGGLVAAAPADTLATVAVPFAAAAVGAGLVTALGFPLFARYIPAGSSGRYTGIYFSVRAIASAVALPVAGLTIAATGSYRMLMLQGAMALIAVVPLIRIREVAAPAAAGPPERAPIRRLGAVVPCYSARGLDAVLAELTPQVDATVVVDDGTPPHETAAVARAAERHGAVLLPLGSNHGKGTALAAGARLLLESPSPPDAVITIDADGQHPPDRIPGFLAAAAHADVVIGDRSASRETMPRIRRCTNGVSSALLAMVTHRPMPDSQCGMRLLRAPALAQAPLPDGRYEAETTHLRAVAAAGLEIAWVPIPAIYEGSPSAFRPLRDGARVLRSIARGPGRARRGPRAAARPFVREWSTRLGAVVAGTLAVGALTPLAAPVDHELFRQVNSLGAGPDWVYRALDPHTRNYVLAGLVIAAAAALVRPRRVAGAVVAVTVAALFSDLLLQTVYLLYDRPRPEEILPAAEVHMAVADRTWAHIASFPSGHVAVTTAIVAAGIAVVPALRAAGLTYIALIAITRITFGAHFPLDVLAGIVFGWVCGAFAAALSRALGLLPAAAERASPLRVPAVVAAQPAADTEQPCA